MFDLSTIIGLTEEQKTAILAMYNADVAGLKTNNADLLREKQEAVTLANEQKEAARVAELAAETAEATKNGDLKRLGEIHAEQLKIEQGKQALEIEKRDAMILGGRKDTIIAELSASFLVPEAAGMLLKSMIDVNYGDDGLVPTFKGFDGQTIATDNEAFIKWAGEQSSLASLMKPIDSAGGGSGGSKGGALGTKPLSEMTATEEAQFANEYPERYAQMIK